MASLIYNHFRARQLGGTGDSPFTTAGTPISMISDTIKVALVTSSYTPNQDTHDFFNDVTNEVTGTGYTAGGATLGTKTITSDSTNDRGVFDAANTSWTTSTISAAGAVIYYSTGTAATSPIIAYIDFGGTYTSVAGTFQITWSANGILYIG